MQQVVRIQGIQEFDEILSQLPMQVQKKIIIPALVAAAQPIRTACKRRASAISKTLGSSVGVIRKLPRNAMTTGPVVGIGPRAGKKYKNDGYFAPFIEFGTSGIGKFVTRGKPGKGGAVKSNSSSTDNRFHYIKGGSTDIFRFMFSKYRGSVQYRTNQSARPFMRPGIEEGLPQTKAILADQLNIAMSNFIKKYRPSFYNV
jgi:HK97 gp10 family phage protein